MPLAGKWPRTTLVRTVNCREMYETVCSTIFADTPKNLSLSAFKKYTHQVGLRSY